MAAGPLSKLPATSATPALVPQGQHTGKPSMPMGRPFTLVGARHRAHLHLLSRSVSKSHAIIINDNGHLYVRDTASREHVYVNGQQVKESELRNGDLIKIGSFMFKLSDGSGKSGHGAPPRPASAALEIPGAIMTTALEGRTLLFGRRTTCDIVLTELAVSNVHAIIFELNGQYHIRDLGSRTGTFVNGGQIHQQVLNFNDQVRIGDHEMRFIASQGAEEIDELEHLVGTATLGSEQLTLANADAEAARAAVEDQTSANDATIPLAEPDDLIPLKEDVPFVEEKPAVVAASAPVGDLAELDLDADPDVSGSGDTRSIPMESPSDTPRMPVLSSQVIDDPEVSTDVSGDIETNLGVESVESPQLFVGSDLHDASVLPEADDEEVAAPDFDLSIFASEEPAGEIPNLIPLEESSHAAAPEPLLDAMFLDPEPAVSDVEAVEPASLPDHVTAAPIEALAVASMEPESAVSVEAPTDFAHAPVVDEMPLALEPIAPEPVAAEEMPAEAAVTAPAPEMEAAVSESPLESTASEPALAEHLEPAFETFEPVADVAPELLPADELAAFDSELPAAEVEIPAPSEPTETVSSFEGALELEPAVEHVTEAASEEPIVENVLTAHDELFASSAEETPVAEIEIAAPVEPAETQSTSDAAFELEPAVEDFTEAAVEAPIVEKVLTAHDDELFASSAEAAPVAEAEIAAPVEPAETRSTSDAAFELEPAALSEPAEGIPQLELPFPVDVEHATLQADVAAPTIDIPAEDPFFETGLDFSDDAEGSISQTQPVASEIPAVEHVAELTAAPAEDDEPVLLDLETIEPPASAEVAEEIPQLELPVADDLADAPVPAEVATPDIDSSAEHAALETSLDSSHHPDEVAAETQSVSPEVPVADSSVAPAEDDEPVLLDWETADPAALADAAEEIPHLDIPVAGDLADVPPHADMVEPSNNIPAEDVEPVLLDLEAVEPAAALAEAAEEIPHLELPVAANLQDAPVQLEAAAPVVDVHAEDPFFETGLDFSDDSEEAVVSQPSELPDSLTATAPMDLPEADSPQDHSPQAQTTPAETSTTDDLADRYLAAPLIAEAMSPAEPVETATAESSFHEPAVLHGPESAGFAPGHDSSSGLSHAEFDPASEEQSTADEEPLLDHEFDALKEHVPLGTRTDGGPRDPSAIAIDPSFAGEVPPPFPAGFAPVIADGALGLPGWAAARAETSRLRKPIAGSGDTATDAAPEIFDTTDPDPESAQHMLEIQIGDTWAETYAELMPDDLSDTKFGMVVQDFAGPAGHLVETHEHSTGPVDSTANSADASHMLRAVEESDSDLDFLTDGLLPEPTGDQLVDQARAFLNHEAASPAVPAAQEPIKTGKDEPANMPVEAPAAAALEMPHEELGLEFDDPTLEEMFAPVVVHHTAPIAATASAAEEEHEGLIFDDDIPDAVTNDLPDTLSAPAVSAEPVLPATDSADPTPAPEPEIAATAGENLVSPPTPTEAVAPVAEEIQAVGDMIPPPGWLPPMHPGLVAPPPSLTLQVENAAPAVPTLQIEEVTEVLDAPAVAPSTAPTISQPSSAAPQLSQQNFLMGMSRDFGSFLGGTPLSLSGSKLQAPQVAPPARPPQPAPAARVPQQTPPRTSKPASPMTPPPAKSARPTLFGDTPVSSMFKDGVPIYRQTPPPNSTSPMPPVSNAFSAGAGSAVAPSGQSAWAVVPHPEASGAKSLSSPPIVSATAPTGIIPQQVSNSGSVVTASLPPAVQTAPTFSMSNMKAPAPVPAAPPAPPAPASVAHITAPVAPIPAAAVVTPPPVAPPPSAITAPPPAADDGFDDLLEELPETADPADDSYGLEFQTVEEDELPSHATSHDELAALLQPETELQLDELPVEPTPIEPAPAELSHDEPAQAAPSVEDGLAFDDDLPPAPVVDESPAALFDATPEVLDQLPEMMADITDVTEAVGEKPAPPTVTKSLKSAGIRPQNGAAPASKPGSRKNPGAANLAGGALDSQKPKRPLPPPPIRAPRRLGNGMGMGPRALTAGLADPMMSTGDPFGGHQPVSGDAFSAPDMPATAFIPPISSPAGAVSRPAPGAKRTIDAPPGTRKASDVRKSTEVPLSLRKPGDGRPARPAKPGDDLPAARHPDAAAQTPQKTASLAQTMPGSAIAEPRKGKGPRKPAVVEPIYGDEESHALDETNASALQPVPVLPYHAGRTKKRKRSPLFGLLAITLASAAAAAAAWYGMPATADLRASIRFDNLDQYSAQLRRDFDQSQHGFMSRDEFRDLAQNIYQNDFQGRAGDGFIYRQAATDIDLLAIVDGSRSEGNQLFFERKNSRDVEGDRKRLKAVLKALFITDQQLKKDAEDQQKLLESERKDLDETAKKIEKLNAQIDLAKKRQAAFDVAQQEEKSRSDRSAALEKAWGVASVATRNARAQLEVLEVTQGRPPVSVEADVQLQQMSLQLRKLNDTLTTARGARRADAHTASVNLDAAVAKYQAEIDKVKAAVGEGSPLAEYLNVAQQVAASIHQINADLADRQKASQQAVADINRKLSDKIETHLKHAWAGDADLKKAEQDLAVQQHRFGAATGAGLTDDAAKIRVQMDLLKKAIDARRDLIAAPDAYPQDIKSVQNLVADQTAQMRGEQARAVQRINEQIQLLQAAEPDAKGMDDDQKALMDGLVDVLTTVGNARKQLNDAAAAGGGADVKSLEAQTTELAAQIEARRRDLADANKSAGGATDSPVLIQQRATLAAAQQSDANAFMEWTTSKAKLAEAQSALDKLQSSQPNLVRDTAELKTAHDHQDDLKSRIARDESYIPVAAVDPERAGGIQVFRQGNNRMYAEGAIAAIFALSSLMLISRSRRQSIPAPAQGRRRVDDENEVPMDDEPLTAG